MKRILFLFAALLMTLHLCAGNEQAVTVNGFQVDKVVKIITFEGDDVVLTYTDGSSDKEDMELVSLSFTYDGSSTGIKHIAAGMCEKNPQVYNLNGMAVEKTIQSLHPGVYIVKGKKVWMK